MGWVREYARIPVRVSVQAGIGTAGRRFREAIYAVVEVANELRLLRVFGVFDAVFRSRLALVGAVDDPDAGDTACREFIV